MRHHTTTHPVFDDEGNQIGFEQVDVPFTAAEEAEADAHEAAWLADQPLRQQAAAREAAKQARQAAVDSIQVTVSTGKTFDGNEPAQANLLLAVQVAQIAGLTETEWTLADNTRVLVTLDEIKEALTLAALEKSRLWALAFAV